MKNLLLLILFIFPLNAISQFKVNANDFTESNAIVETFDSNLLLYDDVIEDYLLKSEAQKKTAWTLLGVGTGMVLVGFVGSAATLEETEGIDVGYTTGSEIFGYMILGGIIADLISIPLFISAANNKRKAMSLSISHQNFYVPKSNSSAFKTIPTLSLRITF